MASQDKYVPPESSPDFDPSLNADTANSEMEDSFNASATVFLKDDDHDHKSSSEKILQKIGDTYNKPLEECESFLSTKGRQFNSF